MTLQKHLLIKTLGYYQYLVETVPWGEDEIVSPSLNLPDYALSRAERHTLIDGVI